MDTDADKRLRNQVIDLWRKVARLLATISEEEQLVIYRALDAKFKRPAAAQAKPPAPTPSQAPLDEPILAFPTPDQRPAVLAGRKAA